MLPTGLALPLAAVELAWNLERRGRHLRCGHGDVLFVGARERLTEDDHAGLRRCKPHPLALLSYDALQP